MDITERLRALYVEHGTNYVQEAADEIERLRACISDAAKQIDELKGGLIEQTVRADEAQASESIAQLAMERLRSYAELLRHAVECPTNEAMFEIAHALDQEVRDKAPAPDMATCLIRYKAAWDRIVAPLRVALDNNGRRLVPGPEIEGSIPSAVHPIGNPPLLFVKEDGSVEEWRDGEKLRHQSGKKPVLLACPFCKEDGYSPVGLHLHFVNDWCPEYGDVMDAAETEAFGIARHQVSKEPQAVWETNPRAAYDAAKALAEAVRADVPIIRPELKAALDRVRWLDSIPLPPDSQSVAGKKS